MAGQKEYSMLFRLEAQLNGSFSGNFSKAQAEFSKLGKEIQTLNKLQSDISSYQKQQSAIGATDAKLQNLRAQHDLLQKEISETTGSTTELEREKLKLEQRISDTAAALERQNQKLETTGAKLQAAGVDASNLAQKEAELLEEIKTLQERQQEAADGADSFGTRSAQAFGAVQSAIAAAGVATALNEIAEGYMECITLAGDFQESMSNAEALSDASAEEMTKLSDLAKELGATTKFTAKESADAMGYMAMAGWDVNDMLSGMDGVLQLAAASGEDLAMVSDIVTDSMSAFGLTAADTSHYADVLAATATSANTNVAIMGETFKNAASVAGALGYSVEDVSVAVGLMANSGVKGSIAGTALKNTFNGLLEGVTLTSAAFGDYEYSAVKADGTMKDFGATIDELRGYFDQMTESERVNNAVAIAGERGYNGLLAILNATDEEYQSLTADINSCTGAAQRMSAIKLDNMNGQLTLMNSAWEAVKNTIGEQFTPAMQEAYGVGTDVLTSINSFLQKHPALIKGVTAFTGVVGVAVGGMTALAAITKVVIPLMGTLGLSIPGVNIALGVAALTGAVVGLVSAANEAIPPVSELSSAANDLNEAMESANATYEETTTQNLAAVEVAQSYISRLREISAATNGNVEGNQEYHNILTLLTRTIPELADDIDLTNDTIKGGTAALWEHTEAWKKDAEAQAYQEYINSLYEQYGDVMTEAAENSIKLTQAQMRLEAAEQKRDTALERMNELTEEANANGGQLSQEYYDLENSLYGYNSEVYDAERTIDNLNKAIEADSEAVAAAQAEIDGATEAVERLTGVTEAQTEAEAEVTRQTEEINSAVEKTAERVAALSEAYNQAYTAALSSVSGQYQLWDEAEKVVVTSAGSINAALEKQITYWDDYNHDLESLRERTADIEGLGDVIASFADGSAESVNAIAGMASANEEDLRTMVENWQTLQEAQSDVSNSIADLKTDFSNQMDELQQNLVADVEAMDLSAEAAAAGQATIQGFIDGSNDMLPRVQAAYQRLASAAANALSTYTGTTTDDGYASGTQNASPGFKLVGENGPELMYFNGGEKVLTASETRNALQASSPVQAIGAESVGNGPVSIQVEINVDGNATPETVAELRGYGDEFAERVREVMEEAGIDATRRGYG